MYHLCKNIETRLKFTSQFLKVSTNPQKWLVAKPTRYINTFQ